jgi:hypothetical protein
MQLSVSKMYALLLKRGVAEVQLNVKLTGGRWKQQIF